MTERPTSGNGRTTHRVRTAGKVLLVLVATVVLLAAGAVLVLTNTDPGREQVLRIVMEQVDEVVEGQVEIERLEGNLLRRIALRNLSVTDAEGRPLVEADHASFRYSIPALLRQRILLTDLRLEGARVVLDEPPGEEWNFARIFAPDPEVEVEPDPEPEPGWGDRVELRGLRILDTSVMVRMAWEPDEDLPPAQRDEEIRRVLAGEGRERVEEVREGYQLVMEFRELSAHLPHILIADPDSDDVVVEVGELQATALPFRPPAAEIVDLSGLILIGDDRIEVQDLALALPNSDLRADGAFSPETALGHFELRADPVELADLRFLHPPLPAETEGRTRVHVSLADATTHVRIEDLELQAGEGRLEGELGAVFGEELRIDLMRVRFSGITTDFVSEALPALEMPVRGRLSGGVEAGEAPSVHQALAGRLATEVPAEAQGSATLDAWLEFEDEAGRRSRATAEGLFDLATDLEELRLSAFRVALEPLEAAVVNALLPEPRLEGAFEVVATLDGPVLGPLEIEGSVIHRDPVAGESRVTTFGGMDLREGIHLADMEVRLEPLRLRMARGWADRVPDESTLSGSVRLDGTLDRLIQVDSDLQALTPGADTSRITTSGGIRGEAGIAFENFEVALAPLQVDLLRSVAADLPVSGTVEGVARLDGSPVEGLAFETELTHEESAERSRVQAAGEVAAAAQGRVLADLNLHELSLVTLGQFAPEAGLQGTLAGHLQLEGTPADLRMRANLELPDEGALAGEGFLNVTGEKPDYGLRISAQQVNLAALSARMPEATSIGGGVEASGRGFEPTQLEAAVAADLEDDHPEVSRVLQADLAVRNALVAVDLLHWRGGTSEIEAQGSFGLEGTRRGELQYRVALDSLHVLAPFLTLEPGTVEPRPAVLQTSLDQRESDLMEAVRRAEVEYLATGREPAMPEPADTLGIVGVRTDALAGSLEASGRLAGSVESFEVEGELDTEGLLAGGHHVGRASGRYAIQGHGADGLAASVELEAEAEDLLLAGFAYERLSFDGHYRGLYLTEPGAEHRGRARLRISQDSDTRILAAAAFELTDEVLELHLDSLGLDFDDASYTMPRPARLAWGPDGLRVHNLRLEGDEGTHLRVDGSLPTQAEGELDLRIQAFEVDHLLQLLQERPGLRGQLQLDLPIRGSAARPVFEADAALTELRMDGQAIPEAHVRLAYQERELTADAFVQVEAEGPMLTLEAMLPIDLGLVDAAEQRLLPDPLRIDVQLHELALEPFESWLEGLEDLGGRVTGQVSVEGTFDAPETVGSFDLEAPSVTVVPLGIRVRDIAGSLRLEDRIVTVDSLVAHSRGPIRVTGGLDLTPEAESLFDLEVQARDARVMATNDVLLRVDADVSVAGPIDGVRVRGDVRARSGVIRIPETRELAAPGPLDLEDPATFERVDRLLVEARDALIEPSPLLEHLSVELSLRVDRDLWIRSTEANVELRTPPEIGPLVVRMNGISPDNVTLEGTISTDRGEYEFMSRRFNITRGSVTFIPGQELDPLIRLAAEHEVQLPGREAFDIRIVLDGTLLDLRTELESTAQPPLSQTDLLSLVVFGREAGSLLQQPGSSLSGQGSSGGPLVGNVAARASQQFATVGMEALLKELEAETARALGLDVLHIQPADTPSEIFTGRALDVLRGTEVQAGRYLTSRLFVSGQARPTFVHPGARLEYQTDAGYTWRATWRPRFLPAVPTLVQEEPDRASVLGMFFLREWRF